MAIPITVPIPVTTAAATHATATCRPTATMGALRAAAIGAAIHTRDRALFTSVATSNANITSGAMVTGATAVTTAIIRTEAIAVLTAITGATEGPTRMAMAVSGVGEGRMAPCTNRPPRDMAMDMRSHRGRPRRCGAGPATKPTPTAIRAPTGMPANAGHTIQHSKNLLTHQKITTNSVPKHNKTALMVSSL